VELLLGELNFDGNGRPGATLMNVDSISFAQGVTAANGILDIASFSAPPTLGCADVDPKTNFATAGNEQTLFIAQTADGKARVTLSFTYFPHPDITSESSTEVRTGYSISLTGDNWDPRQVVTITPAIYLWPADGGVDWANITYQPLAHDSITATVRSDGSFTVNALIPDEPPETQVTFDATENSARFGSVSMQTNTVYSVAPTTQSTLRLSLDSAEPGSAVTVSGTNWPTNQDIQILYCAGQPATYCDYRDSLVLATVRANSAGRIHTQITIPGSAMPGLITIQVQPFATPLEPADYTQTQLFTILYPFAEAHPRLEMAIHASPFVAAALLIGALALAEWLRKRRDAPITTKAMEIA
jgi:hypothetical protein